MILAPARRGTPSSKAAACSGLATSAAPVSRVIPSSKAVEHRTLDLPLPPNPAKGKPSAPRSTAVGPKTSFPEARSFRRRSTAGSWSLGPAPSSPAPSRLPLPGHAADRQHGDADQCDQRPRHRRRHRPLGLHSAAAAASTLMSSNILKVVEGGKTYQLHLDPTQVLTADAFALSADSATGTKIVVSPNPAPPVVVSATSPKQRRLRGRAYGHVHAQHELAGERQRHADVDAQRRRHGELCQRQRHQQADFQLHDRCRTERGAAHDVALDTLRRDA